MTRRLHRCLTCRLSTHVRRWAEPDGLPAPRRGFTRHESGVCSRCRAEGVTATFGNVAITLHAVTPANLHHPTVAELRGGIDLGRFLA